MIDRTALLLAEETAKADYEGRAIERMKARAEKKKAIRDKKIADTEEKKQRRAENRRRQTEIKNRVLDIIIELRRGVVEGRTPAELLSIATEALSLEYDPLLSELVNRYLQENKNMI